MHKESLKALTAR